MDIKTLNSLTLFLHDLKETLLMFKEHGIMDLHKEPLKVLENRVNAAKIISFKEAVVTATSRARTLTVIAPYTIMALMVSISKEMANPTQAFSA